MFALWPAQDSAAVSDRSWMSLLTPRQSALAVLATVGLLVFAGMLLCSSVVSGHAAVAVVGPVGSVGMSAFATSCAASAAWAARRGQRLAWIVLVIGLGGWDSRLCCLVLRRPGRHCAALEYLGG
jgi:hypothetical protein